MTEALLNTGLLFPASLIESRFFVILATLVALNTTVYAALALSKILPKVIRPSWYRRGRLRQETRSIYPDAEV
ncbi:MAG: hypothetical protein RIR88_14 [Actinomycetota bacterium]